MGAEGGRRRPRNTRAGGALVPAMRLVLPLIVVLAVAAPAAEAAACERRADGPRFTAGVARHESSSPDVLRTTAVVCDHRRAKRSLLRRGVMAGPNGRPRGVVVGDAAAAGRRVAWIEAVTGRAGTRATVVVADARTRRVVRRRVALRTRERGFPQTLEVVISTRGEVAWTVQTEFGDDYATRLVLERPGRRPRGVAAGAAGLTLEDDRTLSWVAEIGTIRFLELPGRRPWPGCPQRSRWKPVLATPEMLVTRASYARGAIEVVRACWRATGADPVVATAHDDGSGTAPNLAVLGADARWLVFAYSEVESRYNPGGYCYGPEVFTVDVSAGRRVRKAVSDVPVCVEDFALPGDPVAVTDSGSPAWVHGGRLLARGEGGKAVELDRGEIAGLRAEGNRLHWTNAGVPKTAELP